CGLRSLSYPINKNKKGHYVLMNVTATPETVAEVERQMKLSEDILRYLTVSVESLDDNPSALMQQRSFRDEKSRASYDEDSSDTAEATSVEAASNGEPVQSIKGE
ncbi:MAG: 30S ribosomal protein S6, partial [Alphaproteobacteria bacterium]|nr:30S ribosomal protein S6 [Alphaproteobacteria bacterium]